MIAGIDTTKSGKPSVTRCCPAPVDCSEKASDSGHAWGGIPSNPSDSRITFELNEQNDAHIVPDFYGRLGIGGAESPVMGKNSTFRNWYAKQMKAMALTQVLIRVSLAAKLPLRKYYREWSPLTKS